eukprot:TRINITY_DN69538_c0_g1_i1.p1 TRINITY_DN69538_c0_g1~~TRINITY_DN69538_c0_g1_i1.p1  ORF type:complete len:551 (-),score=73.15 TRINITY_DN69538_c0_g1_i1:8-1636(-)
MPVSELRWNLVFAEPEQEASFLQSRRPNLETEFHSFTSLWIVIASCCVALHGWQHDRSIKQTLVVPWLCVVVCGLVSLRFAAKFMTDRVYEVAVAGCLALMTVTPYFSEPWYAKMFDGEATTSAMSFTDSRLFLVILNVLFRSNTLPLRWHVLCPLNVGVVSVYGLIVFFGLNPEGTDCGWLNLWLLGCLVTCLSRSKRKLEVRERGDVAKYIHEKVLRYKSEFRLSQVEKLESNKESDDSATMSTTETGRLFEEPIAWESISELALKEGWSIRASELVLDVHDKLGSGGFGVVLGATYLGAAVAVKFSWNSMDARHKRRLLNEVRVLRHLRHPSIVRLIGGCIDKSKDEIGLILEKVNGCSLDTFITSAQESDEIMFAELMDLIIDIGAGLRYLHSRKPSVIHGDLKDTNVIVQDIGMGDGCTLLHAKIIDFGLSRQMTHKAKVLGRSRTWAAPEVLGGQERPRPAADVFSFGKLMLFIMTGALWEEFPMSFASLSAFSKEELGKMKRLQPCIQACLRDAPEQRPSIHEVFGKCSLERSSS